LLQHKTLIFDLGDVIIDLKPELNWWQEDLLTNFNNQALVQKFEQKFFHDFEKGIISVDTFLEEMNQIKTNPNITVESAWCGILKEIPKHRIDLLFSLAKDNKIYLLSNTNDIHLDYIIDMIQKTYDENIFDNIFNHQFYSQKIGMRKPNQDIYEYVQQQVNTTSEQIYFFDDKNENLNIPKQLGWNTFLVNQDIATIIKEAN
jgi:putative hydrolase of the HAD superfamily